MTSDAVAVLRPPALPPAWIGGNTLQFRRDSLGFLEKNVQRNGDMALIRFGPYYAYQVSHPDAIHEVLVKKADIFHKARIYKRSLAGYLGNGLLISDGEFWKRQRRLAQPAFHTKRIHAYASIMLDYTEKMLEQWQPTQTRNISADMMQLTLYIVAKTLFDADVSGAQNQVAEALEVLLISVSEFSKMIVRAPKWLQTPARRRRQWSIDTLNAVTMEVIQARRATGEDKGDLLSMLLLARDDDGAQMTDVQVRDETLTLFLAGHETTANALTWTFYLLSQNPEAERQLHEEIEHVLGGRTPTLEDVPQLIYTEQVLKESMRLYPPAWGLSRQPIEDVEIGGYTIPKGDTVMIIPYITQRDARWFPEPLRFMPERFSAENEKNIQRYSYLPFGGGPRICIGNSFAMLEAKLILATIAQRYRLQLASGQRVEPEPLVTLRPKYGMNMVLVRR